MSTFDDLVGSPGRRGLYASGIDTLQVNVGLRCNQACAHCHLESSPGRTEAMDRPVMERVLEVAGQVRPGLVDITGGAPELNPLLRDFITDLRREDLPVQVRTNLTVLLEAGCEDYPEFFRAKEVRLVASLPCYLAENVAAQRGRGVYDRSIGALRRLNALGYGAEGGPPLNLVYNPGGPALPGPQAELEKAYRKELEARFGIRFTRLLTIINMPIGRFGKALGGGRGIGEYLGLLREAFNPATVEGVMCRRQISVGWDGRIYDCDFNLALGLPVDHGAPDHIRDFNASVLSHRRIVTGDHCFGCTAGAGSSCAGSLA